MKKIISLFGISMLAISASAQAADMDYERQVGLIVSGVVDQWVGVQFIDPDKPGRYGEFSKRADDYEPRDRTLFSSGAEGLLSLPLGTNLSIQSDLKYEINDQAFDDVEKSTGPRYWYQGAAHLSWRDPSTGLFGAFGGMGGSSSGHPVMGRQDYRFVGGEAQFYMNNITFYGQGGYLDLDLRGSSSCSSGKKCKMTRDTTPDEGIFGRAVLRWFPTAQSRLQLEGTYLNLTTDFRDFDTDNDVWSWKARYDFDFADLPIIGTLPIYLAYRGTMREDCMGYGKYEGGGSAGDLVDHTFMIGTSYSFNGDRLVIDRQGATLDTPDFGNMIGCRSAIRGSHQDRPL